MKFVYVTAVPAVPQNGTIYLVRDPDTEALQITIVDATGKRTDIKDKVLGQNGSEMLFWGGGGDINTLRDPGVYSVTFPNNGTVPNWPFDGKGVLRVETAGGYSIQYATELSSLRMMVRAHSTQVYLPPGNWSEWRLVTKLSGPVAIADGGTGVDNVESLKRKMGFTFGEVTGLTVAAVIKSAISTFRCNGVYTGTQEIIPGDGLEKGPLFQNVPFFLTMMSGRFTVQSIDPMTQEMYYVTGTYDSIFNISIKTMAMVVTENMPSRNISGIGTTLTKAIDINNGKWKTLIPTFVPTEEGHTEFFFVSSTTGLGIHFMVSFSGGTMSVQATRLFGTNTTSADLPLALRAVTPGVGGPWRLEISWPGSSMLTQPVSAEVTRKINYRSGLQMPTLAEDVNTILPENMLVSNCISLRDGSNQLFRTLKWQVGDITYKINGGAVLTVTTDTSA